MPNPGLTPALLLQPRRLPLLLLLALTACGGEGDSTPPTAPPPIVVTPPPATSVCDNSEGSINRDALMGTNCARLSDYRLFSDSRDPTQAPHAPGVAYQLATELFTDYAIKRRFLFLPENTPMVLAGNSVSLPIGTVLVKSFLLPADTSDTNASAARLIETRLLIHRESGWTALPYLWDGDEAYLAETGADVSHSINSANDTLTFTYHVPSRAECKICHQSAQEGLTTIAPIGPKPLLLNKPITVDGEPMNQLTWFASQGLLTGLGELESLPQTFAIGDEQQNLTARVKGYLDVNCAHCHKADGFASVSGLRLGFETDHHSYQYGICKQPPGWDGGERGLSYDIVPGNGDHSILVYRQTLSAAKDRMPPLGRALVHSEAVTQISHWIDLMAPSVGNCQ
ncbi:SO2930 family diheme c-type cytochrome [Shewanella sp. FJAT-52076]|uniref:SO2930 family diheme c-type cytochrome n=1 Tax=Shewanella sp. FJAT-52076 TaxID=2864202 RepID=UPI001C6555A4|nr:SO2930 family diheme c-type cytochrome [Shewanella sp. FJAT-52076]QYJ73916.1 hypothetical protein K0H79_10975 [Shewanella sp. FJAT-52076]